MIDFPANPTTGQSFTASNGATWIWDSAKWVSGGAGSPVYLPLSGGTMTGPIIAPSGYALVDANQARYRNRIINGDMSVDQRNGGVAIAAPATTTYIIDRWKLGTNIASKGNVAQNPIGAAGIATTGQVFRLEWDTTAAYTPAAADFLQWTQFIEGYNFNDANWGSANALPVTLEFWASSTLTGTFAGVLRNSPTTRSYVFTFSIAAANTWQKFRITIPGDTTGTWAVANNAAAVQFGFNLGSGSTNTTAAGVWTAGAFITAPGAVNVVSTLNANLIFTGVALMVGSGAANAEPEFKKFADNLLDCCRYFWRGSYYQVGYISAAGANFGGAAYFPAVMRATPTWVLTSNGSTGVGTPSLYNALPGNNGAGIAASVPAAGNVTIYIQFTADADF